MLSRSRLPQPFQDASRRAPNPGTEQPGLTRRVPHRQYAGLTPTVGRNGNCSEIRPANERTFDRGCIFIVSKQ